jgi:hypothetical protein
MYLVRKVYTDVFQVSSFEDYKEPVSVYRLQGKRCSCPARNPCKHQDIVKKFKELEPGAWAFELQGKEVKHYAIDNMV